MYINFVADCKVDSMVYLHAFGIGRIDFLLSWQNVIVSLLFAYFLHFPNRSWLHSFRLAWGLDGKTGRMRN